ncbi:MAG: hypothetical protein ACI9G1_004140 [Pirellulaceae bacterium]|jgi:hypothetical protein
MAGRRQMFPSYRPVYPNQRRTYLSPRFVQSLSRPLGGSVAAVKAKIQLVIRTRQTDAAKARTRSPSVP